MSPLTPFAGILLAVDLGGIPPDIRIGVGVTLALLALRILEQCGRALVSR